MSHLPCKINQVKLTVSDHFLALDVVLLYHDLHTEDTMTTGRVLIHQRGCTLSLLKPFLQYFQNMFHADNWNFFQVLAYNSFLGILTQLQLLVAVRIEQIE